MQFIDKILIFLAFLILTILMMLFTIDLSDKEINYLIMGFSIFAFFVSIYEFFRKK